MYHFDGARIILDGVVIRFDCLEVSLSVVILQTTSNVNFLFFFLFSSGSRNFGERGPRKMQYKSLCMAAIFLWLFFTIIDPVIFFPLLVDWWLVSLQENPITNHRFQLNGHLWKLHWSFWPFAGNTQICLKSSDFLHIFNFFKVSYEIKLRNKCKNRRSQIIFKHICLWLRWQIVTLPVKIRDVVALVYAAAPL